MTQKEFSTLAGAMRAAYSVQNFLSTREAVSVWYEMLKDLPYDLANKAVLSHIATSKFAPTIAEIREIAASMVREEPPTALDAWSMVDAALRDGIYHSRERFDELPPLCQKAIGSPANLREMAMGETNIGVEKTHFIKVYNQLVEREKEMSALPENIRMLIGKTAERMIGNAQVS